MSLWVCLGCWPQVLSPVPVSSLLRLSAGAARTSRGLWTLRAPGTMTPSLTMSWTTCTLGRARAVSASPSLSLLSRCAGGVFCLRCPTQGFDPRAHRSGGVEAGTSGRGISWTSSRRRASHPPGEGTRALRPLSPGPQRPTVLPLPALHVRLGYLRRPPAFVGGTHMLLGNPVSDLEEFSSHFSVYWQILSRDNLAQSAVAKGEVKAVMERVQPGKGL